MRTEEGELLVAAGAKAGYAAALSIDQGRLSDLP